MCICNRNWQANDCSERVCQFGLAHVDTPKGDLDMNEEITGPDTPVVDNSFNYPYGTTEQFPQMEDSDLNVLENSAHFYMECSNKGKCDRSTGQCACYDGYDGVACQRASCPGYPNSCSGHGVCKTIKQLATADNNNIYELWDKDKTMGCYCDQGYFGPDCSQRACKAGVDPLYLDDTSTVKYSIFDFATLVTTKNTDETPTNKLFSDGQYNSKQGYWAIRFFDYSGEDWLTAPIVAGAECSDIIAALEDLPNNVIPPGKTFCTRAHRGVTTPTAQGAFDGNNTFDAQHPNFVNGEENRNLHNHPYQIYYNMAIWEAATSPLLAEISPDTELSMFTEISSPEAAAAAAAGETTTSTELFGYIYRLKFYGNPGKLPEPSIEVYLDGKRPSLVAASTESQDGIDADLSGKVITKVWTDGQQGEFNDYFADHCDGVTVTIDITAQKLASLTTDEMKLLKRCLGDSDFDTSNNQDVFNWDTGSVYYPHLIKLTRSVTTVVDGGYYAALWYDEDVEEFKLVNPFRTPDEFETDEYEIYTTKGTFALTSNHSQAIFSFASKNIYMVNATYDQVAGQEYDGDVSCEIGNNNAVKMQYIFHCVNKTDIITPLSWDTPAANPAYINLYTAERLVHTALRWDPAALFASDNIQVDADSGVVSHFMTHVINTDISTNWGTKIGEGVAYPVFHLYKFFPAQASTYTYVAPCSNRGICDNSAGVCSCFPGYTNDNCDTQSSLHV